MSNNGEIISHAGYRHGNLYGKNLYCVWQIQAPEGMNVEIMTETFLLQNVSDYSGKYVPVYLRPNSRSESTRGSVVFLDHDIHC